MFDLEANRLSGPVRLVALVISLLAVGSASIFIAAVHGASDRRTSQMFNDGSLDATNLVRFDRRIPPHIETASFALG